MGKIAGNKTRRGEGKIGSAFGKGMTAAVAAELIILAAASALTSAGIAAESLMQIIAAVCAVLSSFVGAVVCARCAPKLSLPLALGIGAAELGVNFLLGMMLGNGSGFTVLMPAAFMVGAAAGGVLAVFGKTGKKHGKTLRG